MKSKNNNNMIDYKSIVHSIGHLSPNQIKDIEFVINEIKASYREMEVDKEELLKIIFRNKNAY